MWFLILSLLNHSMWRLQSMYADCRRNDSFALVAFERHYLVDPEHQGEYSGDMPPICHWNASGWLPGRPCSWFLMLLNSSFEATEGLHLKIHQYVTQLLQFGKVCFDRVHSSERRGNKHSKMVMFILLLQLWCCFLQGIEYLLLKASSWVAEFPECTSSKPSVLDPAYVVTRNPITL